MSGPIENWFKEAERRTVKLESENARAVQISCHLVGRQDYNFYFSFSEFSKFNRNGRLMTCSLVSCSGQGEEWITFMHGFPTCSYDFVPVIDGLKKSKRSVEDAIIDCTIFSSICGSLTFFNSKED